MPTPFTGTMRIAPSLLPGILHLPRDLSVTAVHLEGEHITLTLQGASIKAEGAELDPVYESQFGTVRLVCLRQFIPGTRTSLGEQPATTQKAPTANDIQVHITAGTDGDQDFRHSTEALRESRVGRDGFPLPEPYEGMAEALRDAIKNLGLPVTAAPIVARRALWLVKDDCYALTEPIVQESNRVTSEKVAQVRYGLGYHEVPAGRSSTGAEASGASEGGAEG